MSRETQNLSQLRLLVAIASYGQKNLGFLKKIIEGYRSLPMKVDLVVLSEASKDLGAGVRVVTGLPNKNPWSLPFAHKPLFAQHLERYDLFAYSEDDIEVTESNIRAFLRAAPQLQADEIPGFLRYEVKASGEWSIPDAHEFYRWKPESVRQRGSYTVAEFTNEHAAFYLLTQAQLRQIIASGGFLREPYEERYGLPETAATDPYTCCGFRKVVCISALDEFFIHHMSNRYVGEVGLPLTAFREQVETLLEIQRGNHPASTLCEVESKLLHGKGSKSLYEQPCEELLGMVPTNARSILSVGCGWGATEAGLRQRGANVTALPLDSVIGAVVARQGCEPVYGTLPEGLSKLKNRLFDVVLISNLLHLQPEPGWVLEQCAQRVGPGGMLVASGPNFNRVQTLIKRVLRIDGYWKLRRFAESRISVCSPNSLAKHIRKAGLRVAGVLWLNHQFCSRQSKGSQFAFKSLTGRDWILQARR